MDTDFLDWALADFSGYVAADELYDGPFCILSVVDNRCYKRILYDVLDHDPTHEDIRAFLRAVKNGLGGTRLDPLRCHHRWLGALSCTSQRRCSGMCGIKSVTFHIVNEMVQSGGRGRGQRPQGPGSQATQIAPRPPEYVSGEGGGPHQKAARRTRRRVVHSSVSVCPTPPEHHRTQDPVARQPWLAPVTRATSSHGPGVCVISPISAERNSATIWDETAQFLPRKSDDLRLQG